MPPGLANLGNTCYMNSTVQALVAVPELRVALQKYTARPDDLSNDALFTTTMKDLSRELAFGGVTVEPQTFWGLLRQINPQFNERGEHGYSQQDADECLLTVLSTLSRQLRVGDGGSAAAVSDSVPSTIVHQLFGINLDVTLRNIGNADEPVEHKREVVLKLSAHIDKESKYLTSCLEHSLVGQLEKNSPLTGANAIYSKTMRLSRLPLVLTVQFVRFFWKAGVDNKPGNKSKIVRPIEFPFTLDVLNYCSDELKASLMPARKRVRALEDEHLGIKTIDAIADAATSSTAATSATPSDDAAAAASSTAVTEPEGKKARVGTGSDFDNDTGFYELAALVTHKGRDADGGHYVAWVKEKEDQWVLYDDDRVSRVKDEDIKKLSGTGGGDWHMAYVAFYRARRVRDVVEQLKNADKKN
jgi:ubiquitin carboxyl-terminal hydrolase 14